MTALRKRPNKKYRWTHPLEWWLTWCFLKSAGAVIRLLPYRMLSLPGYLLGDLAYASMPRYRRVARQNLIRAYRGEWDDRRIRQTIRNCFRHLGLNLVEFLWLPRLSSSFMREIVSCEGRHHLDEALARGKGAMIVSAHYGNWEIIAPYIAGAGYALNTIIRDADHPAINRIIEGIRLGTGERLLPRQHATRPALQCLRRNEILALLLDQNTLKGAIFVDFFGLPASTAEGPATISRRTGAPFLPIFSHRNEDRTHRIRILDPIYPDPDAPAAEDAYRMTSAATAVIEEQVRQCPEQWLWIHNRWRKKTDGTREA